MNVWPFVAFTIIFAGFVYIHFFLAYRAWRISRGEEATDIDPNYVRIEDYFARSFRLKVSEWLKLPVQAAESDGSLSIVKGTERICISQSAAYPPQSRSDDILVVRGSFKCSAGCVFSREIYVREHASVGPGSHLQSIAADGNLALANDVRAARWVDSLGDLEIGTNSIVGARATAGGNLRLGNGATVGSAAARTVHTSYGRPPMTILTVEPPAPKLEIPRPEADSKTTGTKANPGLDWKKLKMLSATCWLYNGNLKPSVPLRTKTALIVRGDCIIPAGSVLEGDLKAKGSIRIGTLSICRGNVIAGRDIWFEPSSSFHGIVHAGKTLRLGSDVCGGTESARVVAFASESVVIEDDVVVHGKLASDGRVVAVTEAVKRSR